MPAWQAAADALRAYLEDRLDHSARMVRRARDRGVALPAAGAAMNRALELSRAVMADKKDDET